MIAMGSLCSSSFECWPVASSEMYWVERILRLGLSTNYFLKCPKNVESNLELYLGIIEKFFLKRHKTSMIVREAQEKNSMA